MALATQCPHCYTSFRVANDQLKLYAGMVRCGACKQTFNGIEHLIPPGSTPKHAPEPALDLAPIPVAEQPPTSEQEEIAVSAPIEPAQPDLANTSDQDADQDADQHDDLESNLRALLQEIKVRQQDEEDTAEQSSETTMPAEPIAQASAEPPAPDNAAEEALVHLEMLETEEEPPVSPAAKPRPKALTASLDFDLDDNFSPVVTAATTPIKSNKKTLDAEEIEEIRSLETAIESELNLYDDGEDKTDKDLAPDHAATLSSPLGNLASKFKAEDLSPEIEDEAEPISESTSAPPQQEAATESHANDIEETPDFVRRAQRHQRYGKWTSIALSFGVLVGLFAALAQASYFFRNAIAAEYPQTKPHLLKFCQIAKCEIKLPAQRSQLEISGSELQIVTNEPLVNELNFQIQNKGKSAQTWPHLELILKDIRGKTVLQKAIPPSVYLENKAQLATGIPGNSESAHKLNFELAIPKASSYAVELFYP